MSAPKQRTGFRSLLLAGCALALLAIGADGGCHPKIVVPAHESAIAEDGGVPVFINLRQPLLPASRLSVSVLAGIDTPPARVTSLTDPAAPRLVVTNRRAEALLDANDLSEGRNSLFVSIDRDGDGTVDHTTSATFSWEPRLALVDPDPCETLDPGTCLLPYPSNYFTRPDAATDTGVRVDIPVEATPRNVGGVPVDPEEFNRNDGFSPGQLVMAHVPGLDLDQTNAAPITDIGASIFDPDTAVVIVRVSTGERQLLWAELDANAAADEKQLLLIRPGVNFASGERYVVALRNLRDAAGDILPPSRSFQVYRDAIPTYLPAVEARRAHMESLFATLEEAGVKRGELHLAWDFTVMSKRSVSERMLAMRDDAFASLAGASPEFFVDDVQVRPNTELFRQVEGRVRVPLYVTNDGQAGARLNPAPEPGGPVLDPDRLPVRVMEGGVPQFYEAGFLCVVPNAAVDDSGASPVANPARPSLYGHGLLGRRTEVRSSHNRRFADEHNFLSCATDWIGMANDDVGHIGANVVSDFSNFPTLPDRMQQGFLNTLFLGRLLVHAEGFASHCAFQAVDWAPTAEDDCPASGEPLFDRSELYYDGNSQGAIAGGAVAAFAQDWTRSVLGVAGMNYSTLLNRSVDFAPFSILQNASYPNREDQLLGIAMVQMLWDRSETNGHANHLTSDPYPNTPPKKILLHIAYGDHQVAPVSAEVEARTIGASIHLPARATGGPAEVEPYFAIPQIDAYPFDGSAIVIWDSGTATPPLENVPPSEGQDPHETPRRDAAAKQQKSDFLRPDGAVTDVCGGAACTAVDPP